MQYPTGSPWERVFGWRFLDPLEVAERIAATTPPETTLIALSHLGLPHDRLLAERVPRLDLILGGHSHDTLPEPEYVERRADRARRPVRRVRLAHGAREGRAGRARIADFALEPLT